MKSRSQSRLIDLAMAGAVTVFLPVVIYGLWPLISRQMSPLPQGPVLLYEIDADSVPAGTSVDRELLVTAIDRRVNSGGRTLAEARLLDNGQIELKMLREDAAEQEKIEELLSNSDMLEFRILANTEKDKSLIERAVAEPSEAWVLDLDGRPLARWVPVNAEDIGNILEYIDIVKRTRKKGDKKVTEILVVKDSQDLGGAYLIQAKASINRLGKPELSLFFDTKGGQLFRRLTSEHLPSKNSSVICKLGIILNNELRSAPLIVSTIFNRADISGAFSKQETFDLADRLAAGGLPVRVKPAVRAEAE